MDGSPVKPDRRNELDIGLHNDLWRLFALIERGVVIHIRLGPPEPKESGGDVGEAHKKTKDLVPNLKFPPALPDPVLQVTPADGSDEGEEDGVDEGKPKKPKAKKDGGD